MFIRYGCRGSLPVVRHPSRSAPWAAAALSREYVAPMVSCRSPEEIQSSTPTGSRRRGRDGALFAAVGRNRRRCGTPSSGWRARWPTLAARRTEYDHRAEDVQARQVLLQEIAADHLQDHVRVLAPGGHAHLLRPVFLHVVDQDVRGEGAG